MNQTNHSVHLTGFHSLYFLIVLSSQFKVRKKRREQFSVFLVNRGIVQKKRDGTVFPNFIFSSVLRLIANLLR